MAGKKIGGIVMTMLGGIFLFIALIFILVFSLVGGAMGDARDQVGEEFEEFSDHAVKTYGEVVKNRNGKTTIEYYSETDESYYQVTFSLSNSAYRSGDSIEVYYDEDDPGTCMVPELYESTYGILDNVFSGIGAGLGISFGVFALGLLIGGIILLKKSKPSYEN